MKQSAHITAALPVSVASLFGGQAMTAVDGAPPDQSMTHGANTEWTEPVTDERHNSGKQAEAYLIKVIFSALALVFCVLCIQPANSPGAAMSTPETRIRILSGNHEAVVVLHDNPVSRDFVTLLPMTVTFKDYAGAEKITYPPRKLTTDGGVTGDMFEGDFAYYAPWGNLAVFYKGFGKGSGLYILGRIESNKEWLAGLHEGVAASIERMENQ